MQDGCLNRLWNHLLQSESLAAVVIDGDARIKHCNNGFLHLFAILAERYEQQSLFELINSNELQENLLKLTGSIFTSLEFVFSYSIFNNICWSRAEVINLKEDEGFLVLFYDLTEAYQAQMILEAHSMVSDDIFIFFDHKDHILHCSEKAAQVFGFASGREAMGIHYSTLMNGKTSMKEVEGAFRQLHQQEGYLGYITIWQQGSNSFYELSGFHVNLRNVPVGYVLLFKALEADAKYSSSFKESQEVLCESENQNSGYNSYNITYADTSSLFWNSKECKEKLCELQKSLERYEYIEINKLLEQIIVLVPKEPYVVLQNIQNAIMGFEYERALCLFNESSLLMEE